MKMSTLIQKTAEQKAAEKASKIKDGYRTVLRILTNELQEAEMLPGQTLKLKVDPSVGDEFSEAMHASGNTEVLHVQGKQIWRSTSSRSTLLVEGIDPSNIDDSWETVIEILKLRVEVL